MSTQVELHHYSQEQAENFAEKLVTTMNAGALCLMLSIGHRTGLFDVMSQLPPATSSIIAEKSGLQERYVREWLGAMVTARVVDVNPMTLEFSLPEEHAAFLTRAAGGDNISVFTQYIAVLGSVEDDIVHCFSHGGGVPYDKFKRFHEVMAEDSGQSVLTALESHILPLVPELRERLLSGLQMIDVGCGRGLILTTLAERYPHSRFVGIDISADAINFARSEAKRNELDNVEFVIADMSDFDQRAQPESFDFITTFDAIHDQAKPLNVLKGIYNALKPEGIYLMQDISGTSHVHKDIDHPIGTFLYTISCMHCMTVSLAQGGEGLGAMWGEEKTREYLCCAGFKNIETHRLPHDIQNNWYVIRK